MLSTLCLSKKKKKRHRRYAKGGLRTTDIMLRIRIVPFAIHVRLTLWPLLRIDPEDTLYGKGEFKPIVLLGQTTLRV